MSDFVFPVTDRFRKTDVVKRQMRRFLSLGDVSYGLIGLSGVGNVNSDTFEGLRFVQQEGTGASGDKTMYAVAEVIFPDDSEPGMPHVKILDVTPLGSPEAWGDDQEKCRFSIVLDCWANANMGVVTDGYEPDGADSELAEWVWNMVGHFEAMTDAGFYDSDARPGTLAISSIEYHIPITVECECYFYKV
jgi:hypothetical protein